MNKEQRRVYNRLRAAECRAAFMMDKSCVNCGSIEKLELDHIDRSLKTNPLAHNVWSWSEERRNAELDKCQVLCKSCHQIKTMREVHIPITHGTHTKGYARGCRCEDCTIAHRLYNQESRLRTALRRA